MKKFLACVLIISLSGCMFADAKKTDVSLDTHKFKWKYENNLVYENDKIKITMFPAENQEGFFDDIYYRYEVSGETAAVKYLSKAYDVYLMDISNKTAFPRNIELRKMQIKNAGEFYRIISPLDAPSQLKRMNPKGMTKNVYNTAAIIVVTAAIAAMAVVFSRFPAAGGSAKRKNDDLFQIKEYKKYGIFSPLFHKTNYTYTDCILENIVIPSNSHKTGLVFVFKQKKKGAGELVAE